jgi:hypothetical protein
MTLIELLFFVFFALMGAIAGMWGAHRYGWLGGVGGFLVGFFGVWAGLYALGSVLEFFAGIIYSGWPKRPACRTGKCHSRDYKLQRLADGQYGYGCGCGLQYRKRGLRFLEVQTDGSERPYMIWRAFRGWFPEEQ